jgi:hypothetical protein
MWRAVPQGFNATEELPGVSLRGAPMRTTSSSDSGDGFVTDWFSWVSAHPLRYSDMNIPCERTKQYDMLHANIYKNFVFAGGHGFSRGFLLRNVVASLFCGPELLDA